MPTIKLRLSSRRSVAHCASRQSWIRAWPASSLPPRELCNHTMVDIAVVDYGMGNLRSVQQAVRKVAPGADIAVTGEADVIASAGRVIFPGQGAAPDCMREIRSRGLDSVIAGVISEGKPFLGICMGLQVLFEHSEEGETPCLGLFSGQVRRFASGLQDTRGSTLKVPRMGWNRVHRVNTPEHPLWSG